jgi:hypothetical protein
VYQERSALSQRLVRPNLAKQLQIGGDLLGEVGRGGDLALVEVLVLQRAVEAFHHAVGLGGVVAGADVLEATADILPTRHMLTAAHRQARGSTNRKPKRHHATAQEWAPSAGLAP